MGIGCIVYLLHSRQEDVELSPGHIFSSRVESTRKPDLSGLSQVSNFSECFESKSAQNSISITGIIVN